MSTLVETWKSLSIHTQRAIGISLLLSLSGITKLIAMVWHPFWIVANVIQILYFIAILSMSAYYVNLLKTRFSNSSTKEDDSTFQ